MIEGVWITMNTFLWDIGLQRTGIRGQVASGLKIYWPLVPGGFGKPGGVQCSTKFSQSQFFLQSVQTISDQNN